MSKGNSVLLLSIILAVIFAFGSHVSLQEWGDTYIAGKHHLLKGLDIQKPPYDLKMKIFGVATSFIPLVASYFVLKIMWHKIPGQAWWSKGVTFALLLLLVKSELLRTPIMGLVAGAPFWLIAIGQLDVWIPNLILGLLLAFGIDYSNRHAT